MSTSTLQLVDQRMDFDRLVGRFMADLERQETSPKTRDAYRLDILHFAGWFSRTLGETFSPEAVTPTDVREYRGYLITVEHRQPATVNRRLAALRRFFQWSKAMGLVKELPTENVKGVASSPRAPHWLEKRDVDRLTADFVSVDPTMWLPAYPSTPLSSRRRRDLTLTYTGA